MAKGKPYSDAEIRPETPEILRQLERMHYNSPEWNRGAEKRGNFGLVEVDANETDVSPINTIPEPDKRRI